MRCSTILVGLLCPFHVLSKAVFAHFLVDNSALFDSSDWKKEISLAQEALIDAFALNIAYNGTANGRQIPLAFQVANTAGFKLFFSFDYDGNGPWPKEDVLALMREYQSNGAYYTENSQPLVSTFEGGSNATDWVDIKSEANCFLIPDWSSLGAQDAWDAADNVADGLFSWDAWPNGVRPMDGSVDETYLSVIDKSKYMMAVSPWFYTNLPGYSKNWVWNSDNLWVDRWAQVINVDPAYVQIISWNDFGESHYIGPLHSSPAMTTGALYDYVSTMPHEGWRNVLPAFISMYKNGTSDVTQESLTAYYTPERGSNCSAANTTLNTVTHSQTEYSVDLLGSIKIYYDAVLASPANITVKVGDDLVQATWDATRSPASGPGVYHGSYTVPVLPDPDESSDVVVSLSRDDGIIAQIQGMSIGGCGETGMQNFNAWVGTENVVRTVDSLASSTTSIYSLGATLSAVLFVITLQVV
ncbi:hypothetical protein N8I77_011181 [Diaporthe amygdali]|uniref:Uncharacterized protein n=1 Tax=Phomopsis amygdali TaxID=1214568 RepID=A0AAD9S6A8_PHOAM|nr:hypothetical protein N8I77_011181 [Diaporthe amygdali]